MNEHDRVRQLIDELHQRQLELTALRLAHGVPRGLSLLAHLEHCTCCTCPDPLRAADALCPLHGHTGAR